MDKRFAEVFSRRPYIFNGDYYYFNPHYEEASDEERLRHAQNERNCLGQGDHCSFCKENWEQRTFQGESPFERFRANQTFGIPFHEFLQMYRVHEFLQMYRAVENGSSKINETFREIAAEGKPFMDISSGSSWGLIPFIARMNPQIPCMATDINPYLIRILRSFINRDLQEYQIALASFDNRDMPIKNNSLDCVTSTFGLTAIGYDHAAATFFDLAVDKEKGIREVYRILKAGGRYVAIERYNDWKFDLAKAREACTLRGKLFDTYSYREISEVQKKSEMYSMRSQFLAAGFQIEVEEKYPIPKVPQYELDCKGALSHLTHIFEIREWTEEERAQYRKFPLSESTKDFDREAENFGIEFTQGEIFYVLRKP